MDTDKPRIMSSAAGSAAKGPFEAKLCSWVDLSLTDVEHLLGASNDTESLHQALAGALKLGDLSLCSKQALIEVDLYAYAILFARKQGFSPEQVSAFFTILKSVHSMCISTPFDNLHETFQFFKDLLLRHSVNRPPYSVCLYSLAQVKDITEYVLRTYFKHFKLYKYAFTKRVQLNLKLSYSGVPDTPEPGEEEEEEEREEEEEEEEGRREEEERKGEEGIDGEEGEGLVASEEMVVSEQTLSPGQKQLKQIIVSNLADKMKELHVTVDKELSAHEKRLAERVGALEAAIEGKGKKKT